MIETGLSLNPNGISGISNGMDEWPAKKKQVRVIKKIINPAVYVESAVYDMAPFRRSQIFLDQDQDDNETIRSVRVVKKCVCLTEPNNCPCHPADCARIKPKEKRFPVRMCSSTPKTCIRTDTLSAFNMKGLDMTLSLGSLTANKANNENSDSNHNFKEWLTKKLKEKKEREEEFLRFKEQQEIEKQKHVQNERENFKKWLAQKKKAEEDRKKKKEQELEEAKLKESEKEKRNKENSLKYQLWLKKKEEQELNKRIKEQMEMMKTEEEKRKKKEENERAYQTWLKSSKYKPKPIPLNRGMETLRAAVSVTYVNPTPWMPNIDNSKPISQ